MRRALAAASAAAVLGALAAAAAATIVIRVTPRELADRAGLVVEGRVAAVDVSWDADRACIYTWTTINVERTHKGVNAGSIKVKVPGGRVGEDEVHVDGTAKFEVGEECFLFLWKDRLGHWGVLGEAQGKFRIRQDPKTGVRMAENSLQGLCLVVREDPKKAGTARTGAPDPRKADCLARDDLAAVVKASVDAARAPSTAGPATGGTATTTPTTGGTTGGSTTGGVPAPQPAAPEPPSTTTTDGGAPPPTKDAPAPPAGSTDSTTSGDGKPKPPAPEIDE